MAFTVEDGTGITDSNSYTTVAYVNAYFDDRGNTAWNAAVAAAMAAASPAITADVATEQALVKATDYIEKRFGARFKSRKTESDQSLVWPRVAYEEVMPKALQQATSEYALRALSAALAPDPTVDETGKALKRVKKVLKPMEKDIEYQDGQKIAIYKPYPAADALLTCLLVSAGGTYR